MADFASIYLGGRPISTRELDLVFEATGLSEATEDAYANSLPLLGKISADELDDLFEGGQVDRIRRLIAESSVEELETARDNFKDMLRYAAAARDFFSRVTGSENAHGVGGLHSDSDLHLALGVIPPLVNRSGSPDEADERLREVRTSTRELLAWNRLLDHLPSEVHYLLEPGYDPRLSNHQERLLREGWTAFEESYPLDAQLLRGIIPSK